jgi:ribosome biogenesis GTPase
MTELDDLRGLGWSESLEEAFQAHAAAARVPGRVVAVHRETAIVRTAAGDLPASVTGRFRFEALGIADFPQVGDWVVLEPTRQTELFPAKRPSREARRMATIPAILPRGGTIRRSTGEGSRRTEAIASDEQVIAANVDVALIVAGLDGDLNLRRVERYLAVALAGGVHPVIVLNKADLAGDLAGRRAEVEAIAPGVPIVAVSARTGAGLADLGDHLERGRTAVLLGSSGVGKSSLLNALLGEDRQATQAVRADDAKGRHTTSHRELFALPGGALVIDTPGLRSLEVTGAAEGVDATFDDVATLASDCRFADCLHETEPGCAVLAAIEQGDLSGDRLASFRKLEREAGFLVRQVDPTAAAEERRKWKRIHKSVRRHYQAKYGDDTP